MKFEPKRFHKICVGIKEVLRKSKIFFVYKWLLFDTQTDEVKISNRLNYILK